MGQRTGTANLPLHGGHVPAWLSIRMAALGRVIVEAVVHHYGRPELLRRLADPFWFQAFGAVMGMDWHSSGITTSVIGALKRGLAPLQTELGVYVCGGRGAHARRTPHELNAMGERTGLDATPLAAASRLVAKVDGALVQDGYDLYLHGFFATIDNQWCVVQQGMSDAAGQARRYHWRSEDLPGFFDSPHTAIEGANAGPITNLAHARAAANRTVSLDLARAGPDRTINVLRRLRDTKFSTRDLFDDAEHMPVATALATRALAAPTAAAHNHLRLPAHHDVRTADIDLRRLHATLAAAADRGPKDFADLVLQPGVGARTVAALAFVAEVVHGAPCRFRDPARFALAHGGKDGHPFPVPLKVYDETIGVLKRAVTSAKLGHGEKLAAIERLDVQARPVERTAQGPALEEHLATEWARSGDWGGRSVGSPSPAVGAGRPTG